LTEGGGVSCWSVSNYIPCYRGSGKRIFLNDLSKAFTELRELSQIDRDRNGRIDEDELLAVRQMRVRLSFAARMKELFTTHPDMLKRV
jgi:heat shock protein HtpX